MLSVQNISLTQFRNYLSQSFQFNERIVGIAGSNGSGKTNLLDAIYYLCFTKSYFSRTDSQNAHHGTQGLRIEGEINKNKLAEKLVYILRENNKKEFLLNDVPYKKFSDHIGQFPCVMIAPDDTELIVGGSEERRKFIDTLLSQLSHDYLQQLIDYNKILQQRNSLLKTAAEQKTLDSALLDILDAQLYEKGNTVFEKRKEFLTSFLPLAIDQYKQIAGKEDEVQVSYNSQLLKQSFDNLLRQNRERDLYLQRTTCGIHKDDLDITMTALPFKYIASQGQRKSLLFALKLSEYLSLQQQNGFAPLLLLDDVFEKLDEQRMHNFLQKVCIEHQGQVLITDTHAGRMKEAFEKLAVGYQLIEL